MPAALLSFEVLTLVALASAGAPVPVELDLGLRPRAGEAYPREVRAYCDATTRQLCYDTGSGKIVYRKTRELMPALPGLTPEHIDVRRDRITFKYSFQ
jgi:hypothetical protein